MAETAAPTAAPAPAKKKNPRDIADGKLWRAARSITLRDGIEHIVSKVVHIDRFNLVVVTDGGDLLLVPKHSINSARLNRDRFVKVGEPT